jgi:hypothetical protein
MKMVKGKNSRGGVLISKESDWNLVGGATSQPCASRTRYSGNGRPNLVKREVNEFSVVVADDSEDSDDGDWEEEEEEEEDVDEEVDDSSEDVVLKPEATRVFMEVSALKDILQKHCVCPDCHEPLDEIAVKSLCLATTIKMTCSYCGYIYYSDAPAKAEVGERIDDRERSTDYAVNVLFVLSFIGCGDGCREAARFLGLLGMPNDTTMETRSFNIIEDRLAPTLQKLGEDILFESLTEEVRLSITDEFDAEALAKWEQGAVDIPKEKYPRISVSFDMAWQQRSSGNRYNSPSGHSLLVGGKTKKPIAFVLKSKYCNICKTWDRNHADEGLPVPLHDCTSNHDGSSAAMEPLSCLEMVTELYEKRRVVVAIICIDDDASTRSMLKWSNADYMKNNNTTQVPMIPISKGPNKGKLQERPDRGRLPADIPEPNFVADPNHRRKVLTGELIGLAMSKVADRQTMTRMDATRIGKSYGYMIRQLKNLPEEQYCAAGKAVLDHHFDDHRGCGPWCPRKRLTEQQQQPTDHYYRCKTKDAKLFHLLNSIMERFVAFDRLKEVAHSMDTQVNESFNNTASWIAPKNKIYCGSQSLKNRLSIAIGVNKLGLHEYYKRLFLSLGINLPKNVKHFLDKKDHKRNKRLAKIKMKATKKDRLKHKYQQLRDDTATARKERAKRDGTYRSGQNMADEDGEEQEPARKRPATNRKNLTCKSCGLKGHATNRARACPNYSGTAAPVILVQEQQQQLTTDDAAEDLAAYACMPILEADYDSTRTAQEDPHRTGKI